MNKHSFCLKLPNKTLTLNQLKIMGVVNISPDSFSDSGLYFSKDNAIARCVNIKEEGADIIDLGGESTRPNSEAVSSDTEIQRVLPVLKAVRSLLPETIISVDTYKADVALKVLEAGADIINDISGLQFDKKIADVLLSFPQVAIVLMHIQGTPKNMQNNPTYNDVVNDIISFFEERINYCVKKGIDENRIIIDPGIGFGKTTRHNLQIINRLEEFHKLGRPILLGASRKSFINAVSPSKTSQRLAGTLAVTGIALEKEAHIVRVHDIKENKQYLDIYHAIKNESYE